MFKTLYIHSLIHKLKVRNGIYECLVFNSNCLSRIGQVKFEIFGGIRIKKRFWFSFKKSHNYWLEFSHYY